MKARPVVITVLVLGGVGVAAYALMPKAPQLMEVTTVPVKKQTFIKEVSAVGTVKATRSRPLPFASSGTVLTTSVKVGDAVQKGQVLVTLDTRTLQTDLESARASLVAAQTDLQKAQGAVQGDALEARKGVELAQNALISAQQAWRTAEEQRKLQKQLYDLGSISRNEYEQAENTARDAQLKVQNAQLDLQSAKLKEQNTRQLSASGVQNAQSTLQSARTRVESLQKQISDAVLKAPIDGVVSTLNVTPGGFATAGTAVVEITDLTELQLEVPVDETRSRDLATGQKASIEFDALPGHKVAGRVTRVNPTATSGQGTSQVTSVNAQIAFKEVQAKPGFTASVKVETLRKPDTLTVPLEAVTEAEQTYVYRVKPDAKGEGIIEKVNVKIIDRNVKVAAIEGLNPSDQVLTLNLDTLKVGDKVRVTPL
ncbi:efflux RND transporter periplasmic adaptor subunit [Deinococcus cellulosilyticus]|uniref:Uncharacterized protein n=1 Tax=Deinococcus cellulosilyticus (strain DSM 18568 / NBRC 106333 / KACC 11606 / 5516J-15) TaxID=1223518 RepID=A0A511N585_DEIC1|nr:efflux RND transporter periplasmic adaptor subunit [Deinococcus cellulosilyticus]GEM48009.1 hypothetical protein DC3_36440 [Deinococcus cellulosilyticus NBRC 106333 = KACC 11606]